MAGNAAAAAAAAAAADFTPRRFGRLFPRASCSRGEGARDEI